MVIYRFLLKLFFRVWFVIPIVITDLLDVVCFCKPGMVTVFLGVLVCFVHNVMELFLDWVVLFLSVRC